MACSTSINKPCQASSFSFLFFLHVWVLWTSFFPFFMKKRIQYCEIPLPTILWNTRAATFVIPCIFELQTFLNQMNLPLFIFEFERQSAHLLVCLPPPVLPKAAAAGPESAPRWQLGTQPGSPVQCRNPVLGAFTGASQGLHCRKLDLAAREPGIQTGALQCQRKASPVLC